MTDPAAIELLREIRDELRAIHAAIEGNDDDGAGRDDMGWLLGAIFTAVGAHSFTVSDLLLRAELDRDKGEHLLHEAITQVCRLNGRRLGQRLAGAEGRDFGGIRLQRIRDTRSGMLWKIVSLKIGNPHTQSSRK